jgi:hypothetical protein
LRGFESRGLFRELVCDFATRTLAGLLVILTFFVYCGQPKNTGSTKYGIL